MEFLTLDDEFQPDSLIENYESLIWSERYSKSGDFQLTSGNIGETISALPEGSYVTLRDSTVPMKVETHNIVKPKNDTYKVVVTGRAVEAPWLEIRASVKEPIANVTLKPAWNQPADKESDAAFDAIRFVIGDVAQTKLGSTILAAVNPQVSLLDAIPQIKLIIPADYRWTDWKASITYVTNQIVSYSGTLYKALSINSGQTPVSSPGSWSSISTAAAIASTPANTYEIKSGELYSTVMELLAINYHGIKSIRPAVGSTQVGIEIYTGTDRRDDVVFDARLDQVTNAQYLLSKAGEKNIAYVYGPGDSVSNKQVNKNSGVGYVEPSGLDRKVAFVDMTTEATGTTLDTMNTRGLVELYKNNPTALFGAEIAIQVAEQYNKSFFLGDIIRLDGEYGLVQDVQVAEFIRSQDATGETAYPTFEEVVS